MKSKIFIIGFNRCGTVSLHDFFKDAGLNSIHCDEGNLAVQMRKNAIAGERIIAGYEDYDVFSDMYYACVHDIFESNEYFREIADQEPDAKFILNIRNIDNWLQSRCYWHNLELGPYPLDYNIECNPPVCRLELVEAHKRRFGFSSVEEVLNDWRSQWYAHLDAVKEYLPPERLLAFDIEIGDPILLCRFADIPDSCVKYWGWKNKEIYAPITMGIAKKIPWKISRVIPPNIRDNVKAITSRIEDMVTAGI